MAFAINNPRRLTCHERRKPKQTKQKDIYIYLHIYIYIYIYISISVCMYVCMYQSKYFYSYVCIDLSIFESICPVGWGCRIHWLHLCRGVRPHLNERPGYDTKQSDGEVPVVLEIWGMRSTPSLPLLPGPLWPGVVASDRFLSMG